MRKIALIGVNALNQPVNYQKDVDNFTDAKQYFKVVILPAVTAHNGKRVRDQCAKLITPKGSYMLEKHLTQNYYHAICGGKKVQVSLKKIVGEVRFWA